MKFAALALVGAVVARKGKGKRGLEEDLIEDIRVNYPAEAVAKWHGLEAQLMHNGMAAKAKFEEDWPTFESDAHKFEKWLKERYGKDIKKWIKSPTVKMAEAHKQAALEKSQELHKLMSDAFTLYLEFAHGGVDMSYGYKPDGSYEEYMSNKSIRHVFKELYEIAKDMRALMESHWHTNQKRLDRLTLNDENFKNAFAKLQDDVDAHTWEEFGARMMKVGHMIQKHMMGCPYFLKTVGILKQMKELAESSRVVTDKGSDEEWVNWWMENKFENPFKGMKWDDIDLLI